MTEIKKIKSSIVKYIPIIVIIYMISLATAWAQVPRIPEADAVEEQVFGLVSDQVRIEHGVTKNAQHTVPRLFSAHLVITEDEQGFINRWFASEGTPVLRSVQQVRTGRPVAALLFVQHCRTVIPKQKKGQPAKSPNCRLEVDYRLRGPDGVELANHRHALIEQQDGEGLMLIKSRLRLVFDPDDQLGKYQLEAIVRDVRQRQQLILNLAFTLLKDPS